MSISHLKPEPIVFKPYLLVYNYTTGERYTLHPSRAAAIEVVRDICRQFLEEYRSDPAERAAMAKLLDDPDSIDYDIMDGWHAYTHEKEFFYLENLELVI